MNEFHISELHFLHLKHQNNHLHLPCRLPWWLSGKEPVCQCRRHGFHPWVRKIPWRRKWQPTPIYLPEKSHGQRSLVGYSPWGHRRVGHDLATKQQHLNLLNFAKHSCTCISVSTTTSCIFVLEDD